jgi:hypothetical protein
MLDNAALIFLLALCLVAAAALGQPRHRCVRCGRVCDGRMAGGTIDEPVCLRCVRAEL